MSPALPAVVVVTGTDTGVGKTVGTAALAAALMTCGRTVAVYKPAQAGTDDRGDGDIDTVRRLADPTTLCEGIRLPDPMAPVAAATRSGRTLPSADTHRGTVRDLAARHDHVLVEGAGGLLVHLDHDGTTIADLAATLPCGPSAAVVVTRSGLGTLNHTDLVLEALGHRGVPVAGVLIGSWPGLPTEIDRDNRVELARRAELVGAVPEAAGALAPDRFRALAPAWFAR